MAVAANSFAQRLSSNDILLGFYHGYPAEGILETMAPGWDFVWIDGQHGQFSIESALRAVRTASSLNLETMLRVPTHDPGLLGQYADTAASALMIPQVDSAAMAASIVRALRFPPKGNRSFGGRRPVDIHGRDYYRSREPLIVVQIESESALREVDKIVAVDGVDILFFGADDMKLSLGISVETPVRESEDLMRAQREVARAATNIGKKCGCGIIDPRDVGRLNQMGYQLMAIGGDVSILRTGSRQAIDEGRNAMQQLTSPSGTVDQALTLNQHYRVPHARHKDKQKM